MVHYNELHTTGEPEVKVRPYKIFVALHEPRQFCLHCRNDATAAFCRTYPAFTSTLSSYLCNSRVYSATASSIVIAPDTHAAPSRFAHWMTLLNEHCSLLLACAVVNDNPAVSL